MESKVHRLKFDDLAKVKESAKEELRVQVYSHAFDRANRQNKLAYMLRFYPVFLGQVGNPAKGFSSRVDSGLFNVVIVIVWSFYRDPPLR